MAGRLPPSLLAITPGTLERGPRGDASAATEALVRAVHAAARGGVRGVLVREPSLEDGAFLALSCRLREVLDDVAPGAWLGVHDRLHLVAAAGADGAHVGGRSLPVAAARRVVGAETCIGVSTHGGDDASLWGGADLALHAPVFAPRSKDASSEPLGVDGMKSFVASCDLPVWALGGMTADGIDALAGSGASGACTIGALWGTDPTPITDGRSPLADVDAITERARALVAAAERAFAEVPR